MKATIEADAIEILECLNCHYKDIALNMRKKETWTEEFKEYMANNKKISAIKIYRDNNDVSLKEAKRFTDTFNGTFDRGSTIGCPKCLSQAVAPFERS